MPTRLKRRGRIERLFGTFQDRLVKEMRLRGIRTIQEANRFLEEYLPGYNDRFAVCPKGKDNLHRSIGRGVNLDGILCMKTKRVLRKDFTVAHNCKLYQVEREYPRVTFLFPRAGYCRTFAIQFGSSPLYCEQKFLLPQRRGIFLGKMQ